MSNYLSEEFGVVATIDPQLVDNATRTSDWVAMNLRKKVCFILNVGATDIGVTFKCQEATDGSGTGAADISGKTTAITATDDNKQYIIEVDASELSSGCTHVACLAVVGDGTTGAYISAVGLSGRDRYNPASGNDLSSVAAIVA